MIVFDLACDCGCTFEGWFHDRSHYEEQLAASYLECPQCGSRTIRKVLSPIRHKSSSTADGNNPMDKTEPDRLSAAEVRKAVATLQKYIRSNFEDVGENLAGEALKIHYGVSEPRNIRGVATESEEQKLTEEGINFLKIPMPEEDDKPH